MKTKSIAIIIALHMQVLLVWSQGSLLITPTRVVITKANQTEQISLLNTGSDSAIYSINFVNKKMNEDGSFTTLNEKDTGALFSSDYIRVFPRKVALGPKEGQTIKVQFKKRTDMPDGEYRSHLYFRDEKNYMPKGLKSTLTDTNAIGVKIIPVFGIAIPIIIRIGKLSAGLSITDISLDKDESGIPQIKMTLNRTGNCSIYGTITVNYTEPGGKPVEIGIVNGVGVYTDILKRYFTLQLPKAKDLKLEKGSITVIFKDPENNSILDEQVIELK